MSRQRLAVILPVLLIVLACLIVFIIGRLGLRVGQVEVVLYLGSASVAPKTIVTTPQPLTPAQRNALATDNGIELNGPATLSLFWNRVEDYRTSYSIQSPAGDSISVTPGSSSGEVIIWALKSAQQQAAQFGMLSGTASVRAFEQTVTLKTSEGTTVEAGKPPAPARLWARIWSPVYRPDNKGSTLATVATLAGSSGSYTFTSERPWIVPSGTYTLSVGADTLAAPFLVNSLTLPLGKPGDMSELPVTLSAVRFTLTTPDDHETEYDKLLVRDSTEKTDKKTVEVLHGQYLMLSPGSWKLSLARSDKPDSTQTVQVELWPGENREVKLPANLFGGAPLQVNLVAPNGRPQPNADIWVFHSGDDEGGTPVLAFKSDDSPPMLAEGKYVLIVPVKMGTRREVAVSQGKLTPPVEVKLGALTVNYPRQGIFIYIVAADQMARLGLTLTLKTLDQARKPSEAGRYYIQAIRPGETAILPAGRYHILIDDETDVIRENIDIAAGEQKRLDVQKLN